MIHHEEWLAQAERDMDVARHLVAAGYCEWAAYAAQQSAEKAVEALRIALGTDVNDIRVHRMLVLLGKVFELAPVPDPLLHRVGELDNHNQQSRYPGQRGSGNDAPFKTYTRANADEVIAIAEAVLNYVRWLLPGVVALWAAQTAAAPMSPASGP